MQLYSIQFLHQITTVANVLASQCKLYSIQFLHQITTGRWVQSRSISCIVFNFYIKSQPRNDSVFVRNGCIVFNFYIKSQPAGDCESASGGCIVFNFYIKSQLGSFTNSEPRGCIVFNFYIKSQPQALHLLIIRVLRPYVPRKKRCSAN